MQDSDKEAHHANQAEYMLAAILRGRYQPDVYPQRPVQCQDGAALLTTLAHTKVRLMAYAHAALAAQAVALAFSRS